MRRSDFVGAIYPFEKWQADILDAWMRAVDEKRFRAAFQIGLVAHPLERDRQEETAENER